MKVRITGEPTAFLAEYARIPIAFSGRAIFDVTDPPTAGEQFPLSERSLDNVFVKDYDTVQGDSPLSWPGRFDVSSWKIFAARIDDRVAGGATVVFRAPDVNMLEGRGDMALLWDIRVAPEARGHGIGSALLGAAEEWSVGHGACLLKVETQNINVPACRFYASHGFELRAANRLAYPDLPDEIQLLWFKVLA